MKWISKIFKSLAVSLAAVVLVSVGIDAVDNYDNLNQSIAGRILFGEEEGPCGVDMVFTATEDGGFCLDRYEASPGPGCPAERVGSRAETRQNLEDGNCRPVSEPGNEPWRFLSASQAMAACAKAGKRLPTSEEWYLAALGTPDPGGGWTENDCQVDSNWPDQPGLTGTGGNCVSAAGAHDLVGNVWEWVKGEVIDGQMDGQDLPESGFVQSVDSRGRVVSTSRDEANQNYGRDYFHVKMSGTRGVARGGYWDNGSDAGVYSMYLVAPLDFAGTGVGFRCAK